MGHYQTPILVTGTFTPGGTQDVNIVSSITLAISAASLPLPTGAATEATLLAAKLDLDKFTFTSTRLLVDGSGVTQPISGSVSVSNFPATQAVTQSTSPWIVNGSGFTQPVSGPLTDTQLRATPVPISGTVTVTPSGTQNVNIVSTITIPVSQSGTWTAGRTWTLASGTDSVAAVQSGTWNINNISGTISLPTGAATEATLSTLNGKVTVVNTGAVTISTALPAGTNVIGHVITDTGSTVSVSNFPATQPVSGTVTANIGTTGGLALDATLTGGTQKTKLVDTGGTNVASISAAGALKVDGSAVTQPVSGTITANAGTGNFTVVQPTGTNLHVVVDTAPTTAVTQSTSPWVVSGTVTANAGTNLNTSALALDATLAKLTIAQSTALGSNTGALVMGSVTTASPTYVTGNINPLSLTTAGAVRTDSSSTTQPISGTVTTSLQTSTTPTLANVAASTSSVTLIASNASRRVATIFNDSTSNLYVKFGSTASTSSFTVLLIGNAYYEVPQPIYTGIITGIWLAATGNARVMEIV